MSVSTSAPVGTTTVSASNKDARDFEEELNANREIVSYLHNQVELLANELETRYISRGVKFPNKLLALHVPNFSARCCIL